MQELVATYTNTSRYQYQFTWSGAGHGVSGFRSIANFQWGAVAFVAWAHGCCISERMSAVQGMQHGSVALSPREPAPMRIQVIFQFITEANPSACTGIEDGVTDLLLPSRGDLVSHRDANGKSFSGTVTERTFSYDIAEGEDVNGMVSVTLFLERPRAH